ncbi:CoA transferase, partial [Nakamurella sp. GG22]
TRSQHLLIDVEHETLGTTTLPGSPLRFFDQTEHGEVETTKLAHRAPPVLDADASELMAWLGGATT